MLFCVFQQIDWSKSPGGDDSAGQGAPKKPKIEEKVLFRTIWACPGRKSKDDVCNRCNSKEGCEIAAMKPINRAEYFVAVLERNSGSNKYLCPDCGHRFQGTPQRIIAHKLRVAGRGVAPCKEAPSERAATDLAKLDDEASARTKSRKSSGATGMPSFGAAGKKKASNDEECRVNAKRMDEGGTPRGQAAVNGVASGHGHKSAGGGVTYHSHTKGLRIYTALHFCGVSSGRVKQGFSGNGDRALHVRMRRGFRACQPSRLQGRQQPPAPRPRDTTPTSAPSRWRTPASSVLLPLSVRAVAPQGPVETSSRHRARSVVAGAHHVGSSSAAAFGSAERDDLLPKKACMLPGHGSGLLTSDIARAVCVCVRVSASYPPPPPPFLSGCIARPSTPQRMINAVVQAGPGFQPPGSMRAQSCQLLAQCGELR